MKLHDVFTDVPFVRTIYGERYLNDTKGHFDEYSEVDSKYDPQGSIASVSLPFALVPKRNCVVFESEAPQYIVDWLTVSDSYKFFWHPDVQRRGLKIVGTADTQPTSSTRTLLTEYSPRIYIKTDLDKKHFRFVRRLRRSSVEHSVDICADLRDFAKQIKPDDRFGFLPESFGIVLKQGPHEGSGVLFREAVAFPHADERRVLMPYHALYAPDPFASEDAPLLIQMIECHAGKNPLAYFVSDIVGPVLDAWVLLVSRRGILPELHGQNTLAEIGSDLTIRRAIYRDFQGTYSDSGIREKLKLPVFAKHVAGEEDGTVVASQYSHVFDGMIGRYLLSRMSNTFCRHFNIPYKKVVGAVREYHHSIPGWDAAHFPSTTYRFAVSAREQADNEVQLIDTGEVPEFR